MVFIVYDKGIQAPVEISTPGTRVLESARAIRSARGVDTKDPEQEAKQKQAQEAYKKMDAASADGITVVLAQELASAPVESMLPTESIANAREIFSSRRFRHLPVVNENQKLVGIVSDRDILRYSIKQLEADTEQPATVQDIMKDRVLTARPETPVREIARVLFEERIGAMPITDEAGALVGIITRSDILRALVKHAKMDTWI